MARQKGYFRVVIDLEKNLRYSHSFQSDQNQLVIDFPNAKLASKIGFKSLNRIKDKALESIEYIKGQGYHRQLLLNLGSYKKYHVFKLDNPNRIVVDIFDADKKSRVEKIKPKSIVKKTKIARIEKKQAREVVEKKQKPVKDSINEILAGIEPNVQVETQIKGVPKGLINRSELTIVIDPGHGGKDSGAVGLYRLMEKDIVLDIGLRLKKILEKKYKCKIVMTRSTDVFIPLEERTKIAEEHNASLFISIHVNATKRKRAKGIETYFLSPARSESALETQARENMVAGGKDNETMSDLELIFASMKNTQKVNESSLLAGSIQNSLVGDVKRKYGYAKNLGVKTAMFFVLFGASMPAVLVETSFVTNPQDARRLKTGGFRHIAATSIYKGIDKYLKQATIEYNVKK